MALTAQQIVNLATQAAHVPGYVSQAGQLLNMILSDLAETQDLDLCRGTFNFNFIADNGSGNGAGPYPLPMDYLRAIRDGVFYTIYGVPYTMVAYDQSEYDMFVQTAGIASYPTAFYTDTSPLGQEPPSNPVMWVWAPASGAYPVTLRYRRYLPDITTPETSTVVPWFPNQNFLITELTGQLLKLADDSRAESFLSDNPSGMGSGNLLRKFMQMTNDDENRAKTVQLDRRRFGRRFDRLPNTKNIGF
jgi:hypothetical protein